MSAPDRIAEARRIVLKIGSALLVDDRAGQIRREWLDALADDVAECRNAGQEVVIVSSGAIASGKRLLGLAGGELRLEEKQAAAAAGQVRLAHAYQEALARHDITAAQVLVTLSDTEERRRHLNARATLLTLLELGAVPVINENDTVATEEIRFGDNDRLGARVAQMVSADTLVLFSDIDGLYTANPKTDDAAKHLPEIREITPEIAGMAGAAINADSRGGMITKIEAAKIAFGAGCRMAIGDGRILHPLKALRRGARCTWFLPPAEPRTARKRWIASAILSGGAVTVDDGAAKALRGGRSLLPAGVIAIEGRFRRGDAIMVRDKAGHELARGLSAYSAEDAALIKGRKSAEIEAILGYRGRDELIHRDDLVLTEGRG
ncbi:MAG: glutamate 5-kinase [Candidatus Odyssella sp.]|nr:glutamate 5-kinase [Candidatus Odyssella sp.]